MKTSLSHLIATQARIEATKPKPQARGEGIRTVKQWKAMQVRFFDGAISAELAETMEAELLAAFEFEPMLLDVSFAMDMGMETPR